MKRLMWFVLIVLFFYALFIILQNGLISFPFFKTINNTEINTFYTFRLYFNNTIKDPNLLDCTKVYPVNRQSEKMITPECVIKELIKGLTNEEIKQGYVTAIPSSCQLNFVTVENEKAVVDFKPFQIAGSCATGAFTAQVKQTLLSFSNIREVVITIQGKSEEILQP